MATLPEGTGRNIYQCGATEYATDTFIIREGHIVKVSGGKEAMRQAVEIALSTERFSYQIYSQNFGAELAGLIGKPPEYVASMVKRRVTEALKADTRVLSVGNFAFDVKMGVMHCTFDVKTVYGSVQSEVAV